MHSSPDIPSHQTLHQRWSVSIRGEPKFKAPLRATETGSFPVSQTGNLQPRPAVTEDVEQYPVSSAIDADRAADSLLFGHGLIEDSSLDPERHRLGTAINFQDEILLKQSGFGRRSECQRDHVKGGRGIGAFDLEGRVRQ